MSLVAAAGGAIATVTGARWFRLALKLAPYVAILGLAIALLITRQTLERTRVEHKAELAQQAKEAADQKAGWAERYGKAAESFASRTAAVAPLIIRSTNTVREYAETPAGRAVCRDADRVRSIDELDASLRAADPAQSGNRAVPADPTTPSAGR